MAFASCKKEEPITEPAFEILSERISGSDDSSFQFYLRGTGHIWINGLIQKPNGEYLLFGRFISKIRGANNQKFIANLHANGELAWVKNLVISEDVSFENLIVKLNGDIINLFAISESNIPSVGYSRKINLFELNLEGDVLLEKVYGISNVHASNGDVNLSNNKIVIPNGQTIKSFQYSIIDVNSGQIDVQKSIKGSLLSIAFLSDNNIVLTCINQQVAQEGDVELLKLNANGDSLWSMLNLVGDNEYIRGVTAADNGSFIVSVASNLSPGLISITKYDAFGNVVWNNTSPSALSQEASILAGTNYFYAGSSAQGIKVNKLNLETGEAVWSKTIPNTSGSRVLKINSTNDGGLIVLFAASLNNKFFLQKFDSNGN